MNRYESVIILSANASEEAMAAFGEKMKELVSANGELTNVEEWGKKTFAYDIKKKKKVSILYSHLKQNQNLLLNLIEF